MYQVVSGSGRGPQIAAAIALLLALSPRVVRGEGGGRAEGGAAPCPDPRCFEEERVWIHSASARYDVGSASAYGLGYMFGRAVIHSGYPDLFSIGHLGLALDARAVTRNHSRLDAAVFSLAARAAASVSFGGLAFELLAGVADPRQGRGQGLMSAGIFWSFVTILEAGYSYQFPLGGDRPDWMSSHQLSLRINVPVHRR